MAYTPFLPSISVYNFLSLKTRAALQGLLAIISTSGIEARAIDQPPNLNHNLQIQFVDFLFDSRSPTSGKISYQTPNVTMMSDFTRI